MLTIIKQRAAHLLQNLFLNFFYNTASRPFLYNCHRNAKNEAWGVYFIIFIINIRLDKIAALDKIIQFILFHTDFDYAFVWEWNNDNNANNVNEYITA